MNSKKFAIALLLWSAIFASAMIYLNIPESKEYISYSYVRIGVLDSFMEQIKNGEIPEFLSAIEHSWGFAFYLPYLGVMLKIKEAWRLVFLLHMCSMWVLLAVFPAEVYFVTKNRYLALISPVMLHIFCGNVLYGYKCDSMWAAGWVTVIVAPLLYKMYMEQSRRKEMLYVAAIGLLCSAGNIMRNHCGFYAMVVLLFLMLVKFVSRIRHGFFGSLAYGPNYAGLPGLLRMLLYDTVLFFLFWIMYGLISDTVPLLAGLLLKREVLANSDFVWHAMLCSLGSYPNAYGLECKDDVVTALIMDAYPGVGKYTNGYLSACRDFFFRIWKEDPFFVGRAWITTFGESLKQAFQYEMTYARQDDWFFYGIKYNVHNILVPSILAVGGYIGAVALKRKKEALSEGRFVLCLSCCALVVLSGTVQAVFMVPVLRYFLPSCVGIGLFFFTAAMRAQWLLYDVVKQEAHFG